MYDSNRTTDKKLRASIILIIILSICLSMTTFALTYSMVFIDDNFFFTGAVKINLNNGEAVIKEHEFLFEPGMTVKKEFFIENESTCDVYYKLYFQNVEGQLADVLEVTIMDGEKVLFAGSPHELNRKDVKAADDVLRLHERRDLQIYFHFPEDAGNEAQGLYLSFDLAADAVQTKNNAEKVFE